MPKPRVIDSGFFDDLDVAKLTRDERLLVVAMVVACADDYGRLHASPAYLRKQAFGYDEDITIEQVASMRQHVLGHCHNVHLYEANGQEYIYFSNWAKFQKIRYKIDSKLPAPPDELSRETNVEVTQDSREFTDKSALNSPRVEKSREELGSVEQPATTAAVFDAWLKARGGAINQLDSEQIGDFVDEYGDEWVLEAIRVANAARQDRLPSLNFLRSILDRWKEQGFKAPFDAKARRAEYQAEATKKEEAERTARKLQEWKAQHGTQDTS